MDIESSFYEIAKEKAQFTRRKHDESFIIKPGKEKRVIISCPHVVEQCRNGKTKSSEPETGIIGLILNEYYGYHLIMKTACQNDDANFDAKSAYKEELIKYIKENEIEGLIDLHMLAPTRDVDINLGVANYNNFPNKELLQTIIQTFHKYGFSKIQVDTPFGAFYPYTVSSYIHKMTNIDTIQIEINSKYLFSKEMKYQKTKLKDVTTAIKEISELMEKSL